MQPCRCAGAPAHVLHGQAASVGSYPPRPEVATLLQVIFFLELSTGVASQDTLSHGYNSITGWCRWCGGTSEDPALLTATNLLV